MRYIKYLLLIFTILINGRELFAQDVHFSQFYATPLYLNPAFTGNTTEHRFVMNYRNQWPGISRAFVSKTFSYDYNLEKLNSGLGLLAVTDKSGTGGLRFTNVGLTYSYQLRLSRTVGFNGGSYFSYSIRDIDFTKLVFNDQLYRGGGTTFESQNYERNTYLDVGAGGLLYSAKGWLGFSVLHLNQPNESVIRGSSPVGKKYSLHGGHKFKVKGASGKKSSGKEITGAFNYRGQDKFDQLDLGFYYHNTPLVIGFWYRGIPLAKSYEKGYQNNDAFTALLGYEISQKRGTLRLGYSYDLTISRLMNNSAGAHELSLVYEIAQKKKKRKRLLVPCAKF